MPIVNLALTLQISLLQDSDCSHSYKRHCPHRTTGARSPYAGGPAARMQPHEKRERTHLHKKALTRRDFLAASTATAATLAAPFVRTAGAAGSLTVGFWDHWVPGANTAMTEICQAWADKEKVNLTIDYLSTQGNKLYLTIAAEALAKSGHDIMDFSAWEPSQYVNSLEPLDDVMKEILARNGPVGPENEYLAKPKGQWLAVPGIRGTLFLTACSRIDLMKEHAGIDLLGMFPAGA